MIKLIQNGKTVDKEIGVKFPATRRGTESIIEVDLINTGIEYSKIRKIEVGDEDVSILEKPEGLEPKEIGRLILSYTPKEFREKSLKTSILLDEEIG